MHTVNIHEAKTHLSQLVELAAKGESFVIAKAGQTNGESDAVRCTNRRRSAKTWVYGGADQGA